MVKKRGHKVALDKPIQQLYKGEWIVALLILAAFTLLYNQYWDMELTVWQGEDLLHCLFSGKFFDFYDVTLTKALAGEYGIAAASMGANYNILLYIMVAVLVLPFHVWSSFTHQPYNMMIVVIYINIVIAILVVWSASLLKKLVVTMGIIEKKASLISFLYLTSLMTLVSTVGFCQLDIIYIIIVLMSLEWYLKKKYHKFALGFSFAISLKYFPLLMFVPLLLLAQKDIKKIVLHMMEGASIPAMFWIVFGRTEAYRATKQAMEERYFFVDRLFENGIDLFWHGKVLLFLSAIILICIVAYDRDVADEDRWKYVIMLPLLATVSFSTLVLTHTQWYVMMCPFIAMALGTNLTRRSFAWIEMIFSTVSCFVFALEYWNHGILACITGGNTMQSVIFQQVIDTQRYKDVETTMFTITIGYFVLMWCKDILKQGAEEQNSKETLVSRGQVWLRMGIAIFNIALLSLVWLQRI